MLYSVKITTTRDVVVEATNPEHAKKKALRYAKDCFPSVSGWTLTTPTEVDDNYTSKTSDDVDQIPREV